MRYLRVWEGRVRTLRSGSTAGSRSAQFRLFLANTISPRAAAVAAAADTIAGGDSHDARPISRRMRWCRCYDWTVRERTVDDSRAPCVAAADNRRRSSGRFFTSFSSAQILGSQSIERPTVHACAADHSRAARRLVEWREATPRRFCWRIRRSYTGTACAWRISSRRSRGSHAKRCARKSPRRGDETSTRRIRRRS